MPTDAERKPMRLELPQFVQRFCLHLLPERFVKIRHFGFLSNRQRRAKVACARALLQRRRRKVPQPAEPLPLPPVICPFCGGDRLVLVQIILPFFGPKPQKLDSS